MRINNCAIIVCEKATKQELFAAEELAKYIGLMTGNKPPVQTKSDCENKVLLGQDKHLVKGPEGLLIKSVDQNTLLITGSDDSENRGTIYGVYEFLERFCGCGLSAYSNPDLDAGEYVPQNIDLEFNDVYYIKESADRPFRGACVQFGASGGDIHSDLNIPFFDFLSKNRYNYFYTWTSTYECLKKEGLTEELDKRGIKLFVGHHDAVDLFLPAFGNGYFPEKYYETHPEYFRLLDDGSRYCPKDCWGQMIFCSRNEGLIEQVSNNIIEWLKFNPEVQYVQLPPHDGVEEQCVCEKCKPYSKTENYVYFINEIAKRVTKVYKDVKIVILIYTDIAKCPENLVLDKSVIIQESTWVNGLRTVGKPDGTCLINTFYEDNLLEWQKTGADVLYYEYYMGVYQERQRYIPMADEIQAIWKRYIEKGILGASTQIESFHLWNHIFNFYTFGRTAYNTDLSMEDNLDMFVRIFGNGGKYIKDAVIKAEQCLDGQVQLKNCGLYLMDNIDKEYMYNCYEKALESAETSLFRNNVRLMRMAFRYADIETRQENASSMAYQSVRTYENIDPELLYMTRFDSYWNNNPGYGIMIPVTGEAEEYIPDKWYQFE
ncbi:MAG: DUF4838 domain-containing protein [Clostridia bacterium]|nr:DUF4838 domain-containing protein [Clostridia bacterium]MBQ7075549.1 DUF4838 domain-containing protein [Clostridia bacterium]